MSPRIRDACVAVFVAGLLAVALTWPLAPRLGSAGRVDSGDGRHGVWNVAWVAHALTSDPASLFDANIFYPHRQALAYSEANLVAGVVGIPVWLATGNPLATYNSVVLFAFATASLSAFLLVRMLGGSRLGAGVAGLAYGFSSYMFAHIPHIQLLMTFGPALSMAAFHHFTRQPTVGRGVALGGTLALTGLACAYYGIFSALMVGVGLVWTLVERRQFRDGRFWLGTLVAIVTAAVLIGPFFIPYMSIRAEGFERSLEDARIHATVGRAYLASPALVHRWMLPLLEEWREVLFPGFQALVLAGVAVWCARTRRAGINRRVVGLYVTIAALAFWASLGPDGGLYTLLYHVVPAFSFLRASARFGVLVILCVAVLAGLAITWLQQHPATRPRRLTAVVILVALTEVYVGPLRLAPMPRVVVAYQRLAIMPRAPVIEFPFFQGAVDRHRHTEYMLMSPYHWQPLINGYSDHMPNDFVEATPLLATFPSGDAWAAVRKSQARWLVMHYNRYSADERRRLRPQLREMRDRLRLVVDDYDVSLYEIIWPTAQTGIQRP
jgi:hypothetical protein